MEVSGGLQRFAEVCGGLCRFPEVSGGCHGGPVLGADPNFANLRKPPETSPNLEKPRKTSVANLRKPRETSENLRKPISQNLRKPRETSANLRKPRKTVIGLLRFLEVFLGLRKSVGGLSEVFRGFSRFAEVCGGLWRFILLFRYMY